MAEEAPSIDKFKEIKIVFCSRCGGFLFHNKWIYGKSFNEAIEHVARTNIKNAPKHMHINSLLPEGYEIKPGLKEDFEIQVLVPGKKGEEEYLLPARLETTYCPRDSKAGTTYFEAVFQVRFADDEQLKIIRETIKKFKEKGLHITKEVQEPEGTDFYLTKNKLAVVVGRELHNRFGGDLKITSRLFSKDTLTWKDLYRVTVLLRLPKIKVGQTIEKGNKRLKVVQLGKKANLVDLKTGKRITMEYSKLK